jgi:hypothetical protein
MGQARLHLGARRRPSGGRPLPALFHRPLRVQRPALHRHGRQSVASGSLRPHRRGQAPGLPPGRGRGDRFQCLPRGRRDRIPALEDRLQLLRGIARHLYPAPGARRPVARRRPYGRCALAASPTPSR